MAKAGQRRRSSIKKEFTEKELQDLRTAFELIDSNQDGRINPDEFKIMLENVGIELEDEKIEELIRSASHAGVEVIDENEFLTWIKHIQELRPEAKSEDDGAKELMEAFRVFDLDNNGYITRDELRLAMDKIGEPVTESQLTEFINMADTDKDGKINYEEFAKLLS
ncbi:calcium-binding protein E63-1 [Tribolium castaneum]|uniref:Calcium-binding protein E63-1-like Protein n=1 Tax=Tribolium castaneum TaxID=7070 RepID=D6X0E3_TRICA|nr:PREDICTED: calcium-binding protein E63-1 [Tribolium castaneum]EFA10531.2 Calcium-binding protein E63-1-like Protein [Tribolium castaneum]|eukprot:XP_969500.1 PREDICTED: calcium-binding protein E63-1 [Tribolium castaneum]